MSIHLHYIIRMKATTLQIRLESSEKEAFEKAASISGIALSAWVRERLRRAAIRDLGDAGLQIAFLQDAADGE
jgi:hypothetical protein